MYYGQYSNLLACAYARSALSFSPHPFLGPETPSTSYSNNGMCLLTHHINFSSCSFPLSQVFSQKENSYHHMHPLLHPPPHHFHRMGLSLLYSFSTLFLIMLARKVYLCLEANKMSPYWCRTIYSFSNQSLLNLMLIQIVFVAVIEGNNCSNLPTFTESNSDCQKDIKQEY